jgi:endonuclease YncB( thermonuclease family)
MRRWLCSLLLGLVLIGNGSAIASEYSGRIVGVVDGDTVDLLTEANERIRIRLAGIDAPERGQGFSRRAKQGLSDLTFNRQVTVSADKLDHYGRLVGKILVAGNDANLQMIRLGLAWHYAKYAGEQSLSDRRMYAETEQAARSARIGLWADPSPLAPWDYRRRRRSN